MGQKLDLKFAIQNEGVRTPTQGSGQTEKQPLDFDSTKNSLSLHNSPKEYHPAGLLAKEFNYAVDYVSWLARTGKVEAFRKGKRWVITRESILAHKESAKKQGGWKSSRFSSSTLSKSENRGSSISKPNQNLGEIGRKIVLLNSSLEVPKNDKVISGQVPQSFTAGQVKRVLIEKADIVRAVSMFILAGGLLLFYISSFGILKINFNKEPIIKLVHQVESSSHQLYKLYKPEKLLTTASIWTDFLNWLFPPTSHPTYVTIEEYVTTINNLQLQITNLENQSSGLIGPRGPAGPAGPPVGEASQTISFNPAYLESRIDSLSSDINFKLNNVSLFSLPSTNTSGIGPITLNPTHLVSETLTVSGASTLANLSVSGDFIVDTNVFKVDTLNNRVGINTSSLDVAFEVSGAASISGQLTLGSGLTVAGNIGIGTTLTPNQLTVIGSGSFTGQLKATRSPTLAHTGTWPAFTNFADSTIYINPSSPVADGNIIAYVSGSSPKFIVDAEGDIYGNNLILTGSTTTAISTIGDLIVEGTTQLGDAIGDKIYFVGTILPKTLTSFPLLLKASASQTVDIFRIKDANDNTLLTLDQGTGLLTASSGFNFAGGSTASTSYSRLGIGTTTHAGTINTFDDLLISGGFEVNGSSAFDGFALFTANASVSGAFTLGNNSATGVINTSDWDISNTGVLTGIGAITSDGVLLVNNRAEFQGTASASYLLTGNTLQVGGFASVAYSRFGTSTTGHANYISASNDLLISGDLQVIGSISANIASVSQMFVMNNTASASAFFRSNGSGAVNQSMFSIGVGNGTERLNIFNNDNSPMFTIASSGNVGIGTVGPGELLEVRKDQNARTRITLSNQQAANTGVEATSYYSLVDASADIGLFSSAYTGNTYLQDSLVVRGQSDTKGVIINASAGAGNIRFATGGTATQFERMIVASTGFVGIGTTGPLSQLHIYHGGVADGQGLRITNSVSPQTWELNTGWVGNNNSFFTINNITAGTVPLRINTNDNITFANYTAGNCCSDIAEFYPSSEPVEAADVMAVDPIGPTGTLRKARATDTLIGIVSTNPAIAIEDEHLLIAGGIENYVINPVKPVVALAGRVPVKISEENGVIQAGDRLTISTTQPGVAMKQTNAGQSIGIALENSNGQDKVLTFVNLSYQAMGEDLGLTLNALTGTITSLTGSDSEFFVTAFFNNLFSKITTWLADAGNGIAKIFANDIESKKSSTESLCVKNSLGEETCIGKAQLDALLSGSSITPTPTPTPTASPSDTPTPNLEVEPQISPEVQPLTESPMPTPDATPTPTPTPESTPEPTPEP